jgi:hypothetical protein
MCDKLVFDLSQEVEGSPNVFVRKDWINILDNQNQNYSNNQSIIDTSQLSNSNKYMSYREAYLACPMLLTLAMPNNGITYQGDATATVPASTANTYLGIGVFGSSIGSADYTMGLKNWFGTIIHSMTLDYNGTTIVQQTPYVQMWNTFKLMTSLSLQDLQTQGTKIGFYPDDATSFQFFPSGLSTGSAIGAAISTSDFIQDGVCNNTTAFSATSTAGRYNAFDAGLGNDGLLKRQQAINFDGDAVITSGTTFATGLTSSTYNSLLAGNAQALNSLWKSYIITKQSAIITNAAAGAGATPVYTYTALPVLQINVMGMIMLKHVHSFFNMCPLLKGVFMKLTLNLNNTSSTIVSTFSTSAAGNAAFSGMHIAAVSNPLGGVNPLMIASPAIGIVQTSSVVTAGGAITTSPVASSANGGAGICAQVTQTYDAGPPVVLGYEPFKTATGGGGTFRCQYIANISVGATCLDSTIANVGGVTKGKLAQSIYLYVPAYTFNPVFEQAYLSTPVKQIKYTDVYQYQITNIGSGNMINNLITNGIANIKSILLLPYYSPLGQEKFVNTKSNITINTNTSILQGLPVFQSPFDPAGAGCTSPLCHISNFNVQISGQNAIYNLQKYNFEQFNNQLYGQNAVNGGLTDGLTSGLVGRQEFDMEYCYYYVNVERMLPVEQSVPKSVQIIGQNLSGKVCDYYVFVEYGVEISIDALTGARV